MNLREQKHRGETGQCAIKFKSIFSGKKVEIRPTGRAVSPYGDLLGKPVDAIIRVHFTVRRNQAARLNLSCPQRRQIPITKIQGSITARRAEGWARKNSNCSSSKNNTIPTEILVASRILPKYSSTIDLGAISYSLSNR